VSTAARRPRADARRNADRLLAHAETAFRSQGTGASLEGIARAAGVAIGTLYGHYPNRRTLLGAVLRERHQALFHQAEELLDHPEPGDALARWIGAVAEHAAAYTGLAEIIAQGVDDEASELHSACVRMERTTETLVRRAHAAGLLRAGVTAADVTALMSTTAWLSTQISPEQARRQLAFTLEGLRGDRV
jgi:AcrR family transcriptional regulator